MPIRKTSKKSAGVRCRLTASHPKSSTTKSEPSVATTLGRRKRVARLGADASAATGRCDSTASDGRVLWERPGPSAGALALRCGRRPKWRNWQTRRTQNPVPSGECGFDSHLRHLLKPILRGSARSQLKVARRRVDDSD